MGKRKRGPSTKNAEPASEYQDRTANKLALKSYEDVADSEDEFMAHRDQILLDNGPIAKKRRQTEDEAIELSDEEVLGYSDSDDDQEPDDFDDHVSEGSADPSDEEDLDTRGWGPNKKDYYNADAIETEQDALDEEAEARRIQQRQRKALTEADFAFDEDEWAETGKDEDEQRESGGVVTEVLPQLQVREDMSDAEKLKLLKSRYPEFEPLSKEFMRLRPVHDALAHEATTSQDIPQEAGSVTLMKYRALSGYMGSLAMYFALLTSTATADKARSLPMPASELREHEIISSLEQYQRLWSAVESLEPTKEPKSGDDDQLMNSSYLDSEPEVLSPTEATPPEEKLESTKSGTKAAEEAALAASKARRAARLAQTEASLAQLSDLSSLPRRRTPITTTPNDADADSDLGDEQPLNAYESAEKARKRKSLRFYTSQIAQKSNKRASAGRAAGGDDDVPHRERLRDRAERLNKEAERRGRKGEAGDDLDGVDDDEQEITNLQREERDDDADAGETALLDRMHAKRARKSAKETAYAQAKLEGGRVVPRINANAIGPDGRREIGYAIEKNKGLTPKRAKANKNPRVKKRLKYEEKSKKLRSMKPVFKGGEAKGGYGGELTGIKRNLVRSVKL